LTEPKSAPKSPLKAESRPLALLNRSLIVTTVLAAMIVAAAFLLGARNKNDDQWVLHSLDLRGQLTRVLSLVQSAETGQRGYLLTGQDPYLGPYRTALQQLPPMLDRVQDRASDEPQQLQALDHLRRLISEKLAELKSTVDAYQAGQRDQALAIVNSDNGFELMLEIRRVIETMQSTEDRVLEDRQASAARSGMLLQAGVAIAFLLICGVGVLVARFTRESFAVLTAAHDRLAATNRELIEQIGRREASPTTSTICWASSWVRSISSCAVSPRAISPFSASSMPQPSPPSAPPR
jgi:CHASE3 domain sensor protein